MRLESTKYIRLLIVAILFVLIQTGSVQGFTDDDTGSISGKVKAGRTHYNQPVVDFELHEMQAELTKTAEYSARKQAVAEWNASHEVLKKGLA